jgi:hypothetical protein
MIQRFSNTVMGTGSLFLLLFLLTGCGQKDADLGKEVLIRVGDRSLTALEFNDAFEIAKIAYDEGIRKKPEDLRNAQIRLLNELTVEMILLEEAKKLGISVTDQELEKAVSDIKSDYPEGEFEKTLLEFAVSYDSWKSRLRNRLIMDKVIEKELASKIVITPEDVTEYYQKHYQDKEMESESDQPSMESESAQPPEESESAQPSEESESPQSSADLNGAIVKQLRRQKAEEKYHSWIENLKAQYTIEINNALWEKLTGSKSMQETDKGMGNESDSE